MSDDIEIVAPRKSVDLLLATALGYGESLLQIDAQDAFGCALVEAATDVVASVYDDDDRVLEVIETLTLLGASGAYHRNWVGERVAPSEASP